MKLIIACLAFLVLIGIVIGMVWYFIVHLRKNQQVMKNRFIVLDNDQDLNKKDFERVLKDFSHQYKKCGYVKNEFEIAIKTRGYYTFMYGIDSETLGFNIDKICEELNEHIIKAQVYSYREYHKKYDKEKNKNFQFSYGKVSLKSSQNISTKKPEQSK